MDTAATTTNTVEVTTKCGEKTRISQRKYLAAMRNLARANRALEKQPLSERKRQAILRNLALVSSTQLPFHQFLERLKPSFGKYASLILITPNVSGSWLKTLLPLIWAGAVPTVLLLNPLSFGGESDPSGLQSTLVRQGIRHYLITHDLLLHTTAHLGHQGQWEWRFTPTGRAVAIQQPGDFTWKEL